MDWTIVISALSTAGVGIAGILATFRAGRRQQQTAIEIARMQMESQERIVREERHQQRLEKTYDSLLRQLDRHDKMQQLPHVSEHGRLPRVIDLSHLPVSAFGQGWGDLLGQRQDDLMALSACESALVRQLRGAWEAETDEEHRKELADEIRAQIRRELVGVDHEASMEPYPVRQRGQTPAEES
ncbi:hypothetical protein ACTWPT_37385 [Nonomuraea sp. 3N208]|uniref:hypothetical protein n=1 Tax=Nonomuraea sp. 3N208 TaxID=3457421 RepID=UPI003FCF6C42